MRPTNLFVGSPVERLEDLRFLRGRGEYVDDLTRDGLLHAAILRSSVAHGRIRAIDTRAALALPGVHAVITAADMGVVPIVAMRLQPLPEFRPFEQPVIADKKVRYVGEPIAVVVADGAAIAEDALGLIALDIEELPAVADRHVAAQNGSLLFEETGSNLALKFRAVRGDAAAAFAHAPYRRRESFRVQRHFALTLEPAACSPNGMRRAAGSPSAAPPRCRSSIAASWPSRWGSPKMQSPWWRTMSAVGSARAGSSTRRIF